MLLGNAFNTIAFTVVAWKFFARRIAYEEECLCTLFPHNDEYRHYVARSYSGIPFLFTKVDISTITTTAIKTTKDGTTSEEKTASVKKES